MGQPLVAPRLPHSQTVGRPSTDNFSDFFLDRDLSLIAFYRRVLDEARDEANPLLERVKFLGIVGSVIDEFAVTRYAELAKKGTGTFFTQGDEKGSRPLFLRQVEAEITDLLAQARSYLRVHLAPALAGEGIHLVDCAGLEPKERAEVDCYFTDSVLPLLMPLGFDAARPFPHVSSRTTALAVIVRHAGMEQFACVQVPDASPGLVPFHYRRANAGSALHQPALEQGFVWLTEVISENLAAVFPGMEIVGAHPFRVFRDADVDSDLPDGGGLREATERGIRRRKFGDLVALMVADEMPSWLVELLSTNFAIPPAAVHRSSDIVDLAKLLELTRLERSDLRHPPPAPRAASGLDTCRPGRGIFASIRQGDLLLHHPYESFQPVIDFIEAAARDPEVLAISSTLYRAGRSSPIVDALLEARRAGKQVRVVIELRARFDEENNIAWARALQEAGAHVVYGMVGLKVHAKLTLVVRREAGHLRRYVHLSSGNYNPVTSTVYTDLGLLSCREDIGSDATQLFNALSGYASPTSFHTLVVAPLTLRARVKDLIEREASWARQGQVAHLILKMNALADHEIIESLYRASRAGVRIDLIVRGICCLRPGIPGVSDTIRVVSIVGRFLEHSRAWYFRNGGSEEIYLGSADLMPRNLDERVEVMVRLDDVRLKQRVREDILAVYLADNVKARELMPDGTYVRVGRRANDPAINSQECML